MPLDAEALAALSFLGGAFWQALKLATAITEIPANTKTLPLE
ncbi:hypothetical protein ENHYD8BJ_140181 [Enhydrobacter sp. 8BJ]|nr:hypothetical protein ENHYD8BJ_140181 [Enhydrobacter sp. 8BJ]